MRMRLGAPLVAAVVGLVWAAGTASAANVGAATYQASPSPAGDAQTSFAAANANCATSYRLVWDSVTEKRFQTTYQTVQETVMQPVQRTGYRTEQRTEMRPCTETVYQNVQKTVCKPVYQTVM